MTESYNRASELGPRLSIFAGPNHAATYPTLYPKRKIPIAVNTAALHTNTLTAMVTTSLA